MVWVGWNGTEWNEDALYAPYDTPMIYMSALLLVSLQAGNPRLFYPAHPEAAMLSLALCLFFIFLLLAHANTEPNRYPNASSSASPSASSSSAPSSLSYSSISPKTHASASGPYDSDRTYSAARSAPAFPTPPDAMISLGPGPTACHPLQSGEWKEPWMGMQTARRRMRAGGIAGGGERGGRGRAWM